jgi:Ankyrin repeats (3 copies)/Ankyrin repeat
MSNSAGLLLLDKIGRGDLVGMTEILNAGNLVDIDWCNPLTGLNPLHTAAQAGDAGTVRAVLDLHPKDVNARTAALAGGHSALHLAVLKNNPQIIELLLKNRADPHLNNAAGFSPLHLAAQLNFTACLETLLSRGAADSGLRDANGRTAAWWARTLKAKEAAALLPEEPETNWETEIARGATLAKSLKMQPTTTVASGGAKKGKKGKKGGKKIK